MNIFKRAKSLHNDFLDWYHDRAPYISERDILREVTKDSEYTLQDFKRDDWEHHIDLLRKEYIIRTHTHSRLSRYELAKILNKDVLFISSVLIDSEVKNASENT